MERCPWKAVEAKVLRVQGWQSVTHSPFRCRNTKCKEQGRFVWYNFKSVLVSNHVQHRWYWNGEHQLKLFFLTHAWGVSVEWLQQFSQRLLRHFASFTGEAAVHMATARRLHERNLVPVEARLKLRSAWLIWRIVIRANQYFRSVGQQIPGDLLDLTLQPNVLAEKVNPWYENFMFDRRVQSAPKDVSLAIFDGNQKLRRWRTCGHPLVHLLQCEALGKFTAVSCPDNRCWGKKRCASHDYQAPQNKRIRSKATPAPVVLEHRKKAALVDDKLGPTYEVAIASAADVHILGAAARRRWVPDDVVDKGAVQAYWNQGIADHLPAASTLADLQSVCCKTHKEGRVTGKRLVGKGKCFLRLAGGFLVACSPCGSNHHPCK